MSPGGGDTDGCWHYPRRERPQPSHRGKAAGLRLGKPAMIVFPSQSREVELNRLESRAGIWRPRGEHAGMFPHTGTHSRRWP